MSTNKPYVALVSIDPVSDDRHVSPGTVTDRFDEKQAEELKALGALREPTAEELALFNMQSELRSKSDAAKAEAEKAAAEKADAEKVAAEKVAAEQNGDKAKPAKPNPLG